MGRFSVDLELVNYKDLVRARAGDIPPTAVRKALTRAVVDSGATSLVLPGPVAKALGLTEKSRTRVRYADRCAALRPLVGDVHLRYAGRDGVFDAIVEPKRTSALLGTIVLEALDLVVDCENQRLVRRDPRYIVSEIE